MPAFTPSILIRPKATTLSALFHSFAMARLRFDIFAAEPMG